MITQNESAASKCSIIYFEWSLATLLSIYSLLEGNAFFKDHELSLWRPVTFLRAILHILIGLITAQGRQPVGRKCFGNTNGALCLLSHRLEAGRGQSKGYLGIININMEFSIGQSSVYTLPSLRFDLLPNQFISESNRDKICAQGGLGGSALELGKEEWVWGQQKPPGAAQEPALVLPDRVWYWCVVPVHPAGFVNKAQGFLLTSGPWQGPGCALVALI